MAKKIFNLYSKSWLEFHEKSILTISNVKLNFWTKINKPINNTVGQESELIKNNRIFNYDSNLRGENFV